MTNKQLNNLVISYKESNCEVTFSKVFEEVQRRWQRENLIPSLSRRYHLDVSDVESLANITAFEAVERWEPEGSFYNYLSRTLSRKCIDLYRSISRKLETETSLDASTKAGEESESDSENPLINFLSHANAEEEAVENIIKKDDQRHLIVHLLDKAPPKSRQAIEAYVESDYSYPQAAELLGVKYDTVKRRVEKIAEGYDANHTGNIYDYFTEPVKGSSVKTYATTA